MLLHMTGTDDDEPSSFVHIAVAAANVLAWLRYEQNKIKNRQTENMTRGTAPQPTTTRHISISDSE